MQISPTQSQMQEALGQFLQTVLPAGTDIIVALDNRVPEPQATTFVMMTPRRFQRLATNVDIAADVRFIGSVTGTTLTVTEVDFGTITPARQLFGVGVISGTTITAQLTGTPGGVGTYSVSQAQTMPAQVFAAGAYLLGIEAEATFQLDFHAADTSASDLAQIVAATFRDEFATSFFAALPDPMNAVTPFHADDPRLLPFVNAEDQYEWRWVVEARMQASQSVAIPQQFADAAIVGLINVDVEYPA